MHLVAGPTTGGLPKEKLRHLVSDQRRAVTLGIAKTRAWVISINDDVQLARSLILIESRAHIAQTNQADGTDSGGCHQILIVTRVACGTAHRGQHALDGTNASDGAFGAIFLFEPHVEGAFWTFYGLNVGPSRTVMPWGTGDACVVPVGAEEASGTLTVAIH